MSLRPNQRNRNRVTIAEVAQRAGVSTATVSRVINQKATVSSKNVAKVKSAIAELGFRPHAAAQVLANQCTNTIGLIFSDISSEFFVPMLRGIQSGARLDGYRLLISIHGALADEAQTPLPLGEHNTDGVLVFVNSVPDSELQRFEQMGFPVILIHRTTPEQVNMPSVTVENKKGARMLVDHLIQVHNCQRIAFLTGQEGHEDSHWREMGYRESLTAHHIPFDPQLVAAGGFNRHQARAAVQKWLQDGTELDAVFAGDDEAAIGVLDAFADAGVRVPQDVAVVGFDDIYLAQNLNPPLTTVRAPTEEVGSLAAKQLVRLIQGETVEPLLLLPTELVIRQSCGCRNPG